MANVLTVTAVFVAWLAFRLERHERRRVAIDEARGVLRGVWGGVVTAPPSFGAPTGWGQLYFEQDFLGERLRARVAETRELIHNGSIDQVFVVPTQPIELLASAKPARGLIDEETVSAANFTLWRVEIFNQLVGKLTAWNTQHAAEIADSETTAQRRAVLADSAAALSHDIHAYGVGRAWSVLPGVAGRGWYGAFLEALSTNIDRLEQPPESWFARYRRDGFFPVIDAVLAVAVIAVLITVAVN